MNVCESRFKYWDIEQTLADKIENKTTALWSKGDHWTMLNNFEISFRRSLKLHFAGKRDVNVYEDGTGMQLKMGEIVSYFHLKITYQED